MNKDQFKKELDKKDYKWREEGEWIIVEEPDYVNLYSLKSIPGNVQFNNRSWVYLDSLKSIPDNVKFNNGDYVNFEYLKPIPINVDTEEMFSGCKDIRINEKWLGLEKNMAFPESRWTSVKETVTN